MIAVFRLTSILARPVKRMPLGIDLTVVKWLTFYVLIPGVVVLALWLGDFLPPFFKNVLTFGAILGGISAVFAAIGAFVKD